MHPNSRTVAWVALLTMSAMSAAACSGGSRSAGTATGSSSAGAAKGGTLYYLAKHPVEHLDPQRNYIGRDIMNQVRLVYRTLTTFPVASGKASTKLVPDLATDTGIPSNGGRTWKFTLKEGPKWEDGKAITCADFQYGISRTFAVDVITGGPNYAIQFLDIPKDSQGASVYKGPYAHDAKGQALFDKAVQCSGNTLTFHLGRPVGDFNYALYLPAFAPYREDQDRGDKSNFAVFSSGPYKLRGTWTKNKGGTFVRNPNWDPKTDPVRKANPDQVTFTEGLTDEVISQRLISDRGNDKTAVTDHQLVPSMQPQVLNDPQLKSRSELVDSPFVDYLAPNFRRLKNPLVRQALAIATDKSGYITAQGGQTYGRPAQTLVNPAILGFKDFNAFNAPDVGDPARARQLLTQAGVKLPYPINFTYLGGTPTAQKYAASLESSWEKAGFAVTLNELTDTYYDVIQNPANATKYDVSWSGWGADWPSASTVIPPLFDSRVNLSSASNGQDYGYYDNPAVNKKIDDAFGMTDLTRQAAAWGDLDEQLAKEVAYIPLSYVRFFLIWGSHVEGFIDNPAMSDYPDLGSLSVQ